MSFAARLRFVRCYSLSLTVVAHHRCLQGTRTSELRFLTQVEALQQRRLFSLSASSKKREEGNGAVASVWENGGDGDDGGIVSSALHNEANMAYAMSVLLGRALPDVRDGLNPVHRRILYAMQELGLALKKPYKKCARVVGEVLGKFHPHGDSAVYDSLVRMAQDFSLRSPMIGGHENFGSMDADSPAAMRYTECRLESLEGISDIRDETDRHDHFRRRFLMSFAGSLRLLRCPTPSHDVVAHCRKTILDFRCSLVERRTKFVFSQANHIFEGRPFSTAVETPTQKLERIASELIDLNRIERHDYLILLQYKMGLNRYGPATSSMAAASSPSSTAQEEVKEKTVFDVKLDKFDAAAKLKVIKEIRGFTYLGLKEAKELVEKAPGVVKKGVTKEEGEKIIAKLNEAGATAVLE